MHKARTTILLTVIFTLSSLPALSSESDSALRPAAPAKAGINTLPPVGTGLEMVKPYQKKAPVPRADVQRNPGNIARDRVNTPYSREIVPPSYRYGSPGYQPDGRGGRGYDFGYPGYRDMGGGGYPHHRSFGNSRGLR